MSLRGPTDPNLTPFNSSSLSADEIPALWRGLLVRPFSFANVRNSLEEAEILPTGLLAGQWESSQHRRKACRAPGQSQDLRGRDWGPCHGGKEAVSSAEPHSSSDMPRGAMGWSSQAPAEIPGDHYEWPAWGTH